MKTLKTWFLVVAMLGFAPVMPTSEQAVSPFLSQANACFGGGCGRHKVKVKVKVKVRRGWGGGYGGFAGGCGGGGFAYGGFGGGCGMPCGQGFAYAGAGFGGAAAYAGYGGAYAMAGVGGFGARPWGAPGCMGCGVQGGFSANVGFSGGSRMF